MSLSDLMKGTGFFGLPSSGRSGIRSGSIGPGQSGKSLSSGGHGGLRHGGTKLSPFSIVI